MYLQATSGARDLTDHGADGHADGAEAKAAQETLSGGQSLDKQGGAIGGSDGHEDVVGLGASNGDLVGELGQRLGGGDDLTGIALDGGEVETAGQQAQEALLNLNLESLAGLVDDGHGVLDGALQVGRLDGAIEGANDGANQHADLGQTQAAEDLGDLVVQLDQDGITLSGDNGHHALGLVVEVQASDGGGSLDDLADGRSSTADVQASQQAGELGLQLDHDGLGGRVGDGHDAVHRGDGARGELLLGNAGDTSQGGQGRQLAQGGGVSKARGDETGNSAETGEAAGETKRDEGGEAAGEDAGKLAKATGEEAAGETTGDEAGQATGQQATSEATSEAASDTTSEAASDATSEAAGDAVGQAAGEEAASEAVGQATGETRGEDGGQAGREARWDRETRGNRETRGQASRDARGEHARREARNSRSATQGVGLGSIDLGANVDLGRQGGHSGRQNGGGDGERLHCAGEGVTKSGIFGKEWTV